MMTAPLNAQTSTPQRPEAFAARDQAVEARVSSLLGELNLDQKIDLIGGVDGFFVRALPNIGLPRLKTSDGPVGARNDGPATAMAGGIGLAATWDLDLARQVGTEIGRVARP
jgi:beta-glucosidase